MPRVLCIFVSSLPNNWLATSLLPLAFSGRLFLCSFIPSAIHGLTRRHLLCRPVCSSPDGWISLAPGPGFHVADHRLPVLAADKDPALRRSLSPPLCTTKHSRSVDNKERALSIEQGPCGLKFLMRLVLKYWGAPRHRLHRSCPRCRYRPVQVFPLQNDGGRPYFQASSV
jgi:hypothetical protein